MEFSMDIPIIDAPFAALHELRFLTLFPPAFSEGEPPVAGAEMQLSRQAAEIAMIGQNSGDQPFFFRDALAILPETIGHGITAGQECAPARLTEWILSITMVEQHAFPGELIDIRRMHMRISVTTEGIPALRIGADPENIRAGRRMGHDRIQATG